MVESLNKDINLRFDDWFLSPTEELDIEVKNWLDTTNREDQAKIAKALIALENHGGGFLVLGFDDSSGLLSPAAPYPANLDSYGTDSINNIVKNFAEPVFHVHVSYQVHPTTKQEFPVIRAPGKSKIPVRSCRGSSDGSIVNNTYYIRRPGPCSEAPRTGIEWDTLMRRCVINQRADIIETISLFFPATAKGNILSLADEQQALDNFNNECLTSWKAINDNLSENDPAKITLGHYSISCEILGQTKGQTPKQILSSIEGLRRYTGWPVFIALHQPDTKPRFIANGIQASLIKLQFPDVGHADFWRIDPNGFLYLLRGYQEDCLEKLSGVTNVRAPGTGIDLTIPVWRVAEFLLRTEELARTMYEDGFSLRVKCEWTGLNKRELFMFNPRRMIYGAYRCETESVVTQGIFTQNVVTDMLADTVRALTIDLYNHFDFFVPPELFFEEEISLMKSGVIL